MGMGEAMVVNRVIIACRFMAAELSNGELVLERIDIQIVALLVEIECERYGYAIANKLGRCSSFLRRYEIESA